MTVPPSDAAPGDGIGRRAAWAGAVALLGLGALVRAYNFWSPELWIDEYATRWVLADVGWSETARRAVQAHGQSPLYYLVAKLSAAVLGVDAFSLRLPSVLLGIGIVALAYPLGVAIFRQREAALLTVAAFAVNEQLIWYSQEARPYALTLFLVLLCVLSYLAVLERDVLARRVAYVLSAAAVFYAHYLFAFIVVVQALHLLLTGGLARPRRRAWALTLLGLVALCSPGAPQLARLFERRAALNWLPPARWLDVLSLATDLLNPLGVAVVALSVLLAGPSARQLRALLDRRRAVFVLAWLGVPIVVFLVVPPLFGVSLFFVRYLLFVLPAVLLLTAWLMALGRPGAWRRWIPLAAFLAMSVSWSLVPAFLHGRTFVPHDDEGWSRAVPTLARFAAAGDAILYSTGFVEADQLGRPDLDPLVVSFIESPVTANLPAGRSLPMLGLPFRVDAGTQAYMSSVIAQAARAARVWIIGLGPAVRTAAVALERGASFRIVGTRFYGSVVLVMLEAPGR